MTIQGSRIDWSSTSIPWAIDRDGRRIQIRDNGIVYLIDGI